MIEAKKYIKKEEALGLPHQRFYLRRNRVVIKPSLIKGLDRFEARLFPMILVIDFNKTKGGENRCTS
ncbi:MAG: hypothetical protein QW520_08480 [Methanomassiliicoccales archaeon]